MTESFCIRLPSLHAAGSHPGGIICRHLWPGHARLENQDIYWKPENFPFTEKEAAKIYGDYRALNPDDLALMLHETNRTKLAEDFKHRAELTSLARFSGQERPSPERLTLEQAQKMLLWRWLEEELQEEVNQLSRLCAHQETNLAECLLDEEETSALAWDGATDLDWKICSANALIFIPRDFPVLLEGGMAMDCFEILDFRPDPELAISLGANRACADKLLTATASFSTIAGQISFFSETVSRRWLIWRD